jgi:hypothetical protein
MVIHQNLLWLEAEPGQLSLLLKDPTLSRLVAVQVAPNLAGFRKEDQEKVQARLAKLGHIPAIEGRWS